MKRLLEYLKISFACFLGVLIGFVLCCLGGMFAIEIVKIFTYNTTAILITGVVGYFATIALILIVGLKFSRKQKNSQKDTRE
ncbi:MAG: hypothetical protein IKT41_00750 [Clostridia bacterium]|nr:hypothetical protein [Clostridia bacterium]